MPTMVMSQPPKASGNSTSMRKRQKNKNDNIVAISYMYVGAPKKKYTFYVRERLLYRSNVEVTFEDVYSYLASIANDESVSLHYSVNGLYVPITTTGQLHTFIRHVHNDPGVFLYVENQDYVWNVTPQTKGHKMEKRVPVSGGNPVDSEQYDSLDDEEEGISQDGGDGGDGGNVTEEDVEDEEYADEEDDYDDDQAPPILTDKSAPVILGEKISVKEAFLEAKPRSLSTKSGDSGPPNEFTPAPRIKLDDDELVLSSDEVLPSKKWTDTESYDHLKGLICEALARKSLGDTATVLAEQLIRDVWNPNVPFDKKVLRDAVSLLKSGLSCGLVSYMHQVFSRYADQDDKKVKISEKKKMGAERIPVNDSQFLVEFIENGLIAACDILEGVQNVSQFNVQIEYFNNVWTQLAKKKAAEKDPIPTMCEIYDHLKLAVSSAHFGFSILDPVFSGSCECQGAIRLVIAELQKVLVSLKLTLQKSHGQHTPELKRFTVDAIAMVLGRYTSRKCAEHESIDHALLCSETSKWRADASKSYHQWMQFRHKGESRHRTSTQCYDTSLPRPLPYAVRPDSAVCEPRVAPICNSLGDLHTVSYPISMQTHCQQPPIESQQLENVIKTLEKLSTEEQKMVIGKENTIPTGTASSATAISKSSTTTITSTPGGAQIVNNKKMSSELQKMVDGMMEKYKSTPQHNYVYPPPPKPGAILIPTGGLAKCRCSKNCQETLMEPAYEYIERFNEPRQTVWEKTKQKRFKKN